MTLPFERKSFVRTVFFASLFFLSISLGSINHVAATASAPGCSRAVEAPCGHFQFHGSICIDGPADVECWLNNPVPAAAFAWYDPNGFANRWWWVFPMPPPVAYAIPFPTGNFLHTDGFEGQLNPGVLVATIDVNIMYVDTASGNLVTWTRTVTITRIACNAPVGGMSFSLGESSSLTPYNGLTLTIIGATVATVGTAIYVKRVKHRKDKQ